MVVRAGVVSDNRQTARQAGRQIDGNGFREREKGREREKRELKELKHQYLI